MTLGVGCVTSITDRVAKRAAIPTFRSELIVSSAELTDRTTQRTLIGQP